MEEERPVVEEERDVVEQVAPEQHLAYICELLKRV